jgi:hypothetical protein
MADQSGTAFFSLTQAEYAAGILGKSITFALLVRIV